MKRIDGHTYTSSLSNSLSNMFLNQLPEIKIYIINYLAVIDLMKLNTTCLAMYQFIQNTHWSHAIEYLNPDNIEYLTSNYKFNKYRFLRYNYTSVLTHEKINLLSKCTQLELSLIGHDNIDYMNISCELYNNLRYLKIYEYFSGSITNEVITLITQNCKNLFHLELDSYYSLTEENIKSISTLQLRVLGIGCKNTITDSSALHITKITTLETLKLDNCVISDKFLENLIKIPNLNNLVFSYCKCDNLLKYISQIQLRNLTLYDCNVSN